VTTALMGAVMLITASLTGHPWQLDSHMLYFAALAGAVTLVDIRALLLGTGLVAVQHLGLSIAVPSLIYPPADLVLNLERAAIHGVVLVAEAVALIYTVWLRQNQVQQSAADQSRVAEALADAPALLLGEDEVVALLPPVALTDIDDSKTNLEWILTITFHAEF